MSADLYRLIPGAPPRISIEPEPVPTVERIPKTYDGCTWYAYTHTAAGERIGATASTKRRALERFSERWGMFA